MPRIKLKRKERKTQKLRGKRYHGYGQVSGGHRKGGQRGGRGRAGIKDHMRHKFLMEGYEIGSRGFTHHGPYRLRFSINVGKLIELAEQNKIESHEEDGKLVIDTTKLMITKILGGGKVLRPVKIILGSNTAITDKAKEKIMKARGEIIKAS